MTPPDLAALARELIDVAPRDGWRDFLGVELPKLLTLSRTAGRAEGLEDAKWRPIETAPTDTTQGDFLISNWNSQGDCCWVQIVRNPRNHHGMTIASHWMRLPIHRPSALASDPAPGDPELEICNRKLTKAEAEGICTSPDLCFEFNDWVRCGPCSLKLAARPAPGEQPAAYHGLGNAAIGAGEPGTAYQSAALGNQVAKERHAIADEARRYAGHYPQASDGRNTFILLAEWIEARGAAPAHPTEPGEVERLRAIETAARHLLDEIDGEGGHSTEDDNPGSKGCTICAALKSMQAALSTPQPKGETPRCPFMDAPCDCQDLPDDQKCLPGRGGK